MSVTIPHQFGQNANEQGALHTIPAVNTIHTSQIIQTHVEHSSSVTMNEPQTHTQTDPHDKPEPETA